MKFAPDPSESQIIAYLKKKESESEFLLKKKLKESAVYNPYRRAPAPSTTPQNNSAGSANAAIIQQPNPSAPTQPAAPAQPQPRIYQNNTPPKPQTQTQAYPPRQIQQPVRTAPAPSVPVQQPRPVAPPAPAAPSANSACQWSIWHAIALLISSIFILELNIILCRLMQEF